jgi:hypothetical protein
MMTFTVSARKKPTETACFTNTDLSGKNLSQGKPGIRKETCGYSSQNALCCLIQVEWTGPASYPITKRLMDHIGWALKG